MMIMWERGGRKRWEVVRMSASDKGGSGKVTASTSSLLMVSVASTLTDAGRLKHVRY